MDFVGFMYLLEQQALWFSRLDLLSVPVEVEAVIHEVLVDLHAERWVAEVVESASKRFGLRRPVRQSGLLRIPD